MVFIIILVAVVAIIAAVTIYDHFVTAQAETETKSGR